MGKKNDVTRRFVFIDRDGVINVERNDFTTTIDQWDWAPGAREGIKLLTEAGFGIIVVTNQSCIARGIQTEEGLAVLHDFMTDQIRKAGGNILHIYHCPHRNEDMCNCRKPNPGMLIKAAKDYSIILSETFFIGDSPRDIEAGISAGTHTIYIENSHSVVTSPVSEEEVDFSACNLLDAARIVIRESRTQ